MIGYEEFCKDNPPDMLVVAGDVNATLACAITACKRGIKVAHLEAGLRSYDRTMPEEINRVLTDQISSILWTPSADADANLKKEGIPDSRIRRVGNIMIDALELMRPKWEALSPWVGLDLEAKKYGLVTLHRPANVDHVSSLRVLVDQLELLSEKVPLVFPLHPRTKKMLELFSLNNQLAGIPNLHLIAPLNYQNFISYLSQSTFIITDSGGAQEESTYLGVPCFTVRPNTERPITISMGTNQLIRPNDLSEIPGKIEDTVGRVPEFWDGCTAGRIVKDLVSEFDG